MNDQQFLAQFEAADLDTFDHRAHIRMGWLYLRQYGWAAGTAKIRSGLGQFANQAGVPHKYHETITLFWAHLIQVGIIQQPALTNFDTFVAAFPHLLDGQSLRKHYSAEQLASGRHTWVEPDLIPLPVMG